METGFTEPSRMNVNATFKSKFKPRALLCPSIGIAGIQCTVLISGTYRALRKTKWDKRLFRSALLKGKGGLQVTRPVQTADRHGGGNIPRAASRAAFSCAVRLMLVF